MNMFKRAGGLLLVLTLALAGVCRAESGASMRAGRRSVTFQNALYCIENDGVYRFEGADKSLVCAGAFDMYGSILTDGERVYVMQSAPEETGVWRIDIRSGQSASAISLAGDIREIAGIIGEKLYLLRADPEDDFAGLELLSADLRTGECETLAGFLREAQLCNDSLILSGFRTDVGPSPLSVMDSQENIALIDENALGGAGVDGGVYYWTCDPDENAIWDQMRLCRAADGGAQTLLSVDCPGATAFAGTFSDKFAAFFETGSGSFKQYTVDYETKTVSDCLAPDGNVKSWYTDGDTVYACSYATGDLYRLDGGEGALVAQIPGASILDIVNGFLYYEEEDRVVQARRIGEASVS